MGQHSAESGEWYTPSEWTDRVRKVLGTYFDPCASPESAQYHDLGRYWSSVGLNESWPSMPAFVNPPGSCRPSDGFKFGSCMNNGRCSCKLPAQFLRKLSEHWPGGIYLAYSVNQLRTLKKIVDCYINSIAVPPSRIAYISPETMIPARGTPCDSMFVAVGLSTDTEKEFAQVFRSAGCAIYTAEES